MPSTAIAKKTSAESKVALNRRHEESRGGHWTATGISETAEAPVASYSSTQDTNAVFNQLRPKSSLEDAIDPPLPIERDSTRSRAPLCPPLSLRRPAYPGLSLLSAREPPATIRIPPRFGPSTKHRTSLPASPSLFDVPSPMSSRSISTIDEIVSRHRSTMMNVESAVKEKARKEIGLSPRTPGAGGVDRRVISGERMSIDIPTRRASTPGAKVLEITPRSSSRLALRTPSDADDITPSAPSGVTRHVVNEPCTPARTSFSSSDLLSPHPIAPASIKRSLSWSRANRSRTSSPIPPPSPRHKELDSSHGIALYLRSPHLNRFIELSQPYPRPPLRVSLADVGRANGHPVLVFLGLGCVRHLSAIFEDLAWAYGLRLICVDRWGLGKTDQVEEHRRTPLEWAVVIERILGELGIDKFGILAHSAGAVFGAAVALRMRNRLVGPLQLLAPWVGQESDHSYKWLRWVPNGVIKGAVAAEYRLQSYLIGKPPPLKYRPVEFNMNHLDPEPSDESVGKDAALSPTGRQKPSIAHRASSLFRGMPISPRRSRRSSTTPDTPRSVSVASIGCPVTPITPSTSTESETLRSPVTPLASVEDLDTFDGFNLHEFKSALEAAEKSPLYSPSCVRRSKSSSSSTSSRSSTTEESRPTRPKDPALVGALLQASHAESEPGTTSDLMSIILNRANKSWGFSYTEVAYPMTVWWGADDERISRKSVQWLQSATGCEVRELKGESHNLMTSGAVLCEVFGVLRKERKAEKRAAI